MNSPAVSIIIRTYNEAKHLPKLLEGIAQQTVPPHEVIVVDSGSTDNTVQIAENAGAKIVPIRKADFSFGRALNVGCAAATGEILLFASGHVYPERADWIEKICAPFEDAATVSVYGRQRGGASNKFSEHRLFERWFPNRSAAVQSNYFCNNANCAVRRTAWETHPYDEALTGLEDLAWAKHMFARDAKIAYQHEASIIHVHEESWAQVRNRYRREAIALRHIEPEEAKGAVYFARLAVANIFWDTSAAVSQRRWSKLGQIFLFRLNQYFGAWEGMKTDTKPSQEVLETFYYPATTQNDLDDPVSNAPERLIYNE